MFGGSIAFSTYMLIQLSPTYLLMFLFCPLVEQTGVALGHELTDKMPLNEYYEYFGPDYTLHVAPSNMENKNTHRHLDEIRSRLLENLTKLRHAPSVQFQERPPEAEQPEVIFRVTNFFFLAYIRYNSNGFHTLDLGRHSDNVTICVESEC